jgi:N-6 DNA Methylase
MAGERLAMCSDRVHIQAHKDWIGLLQPVGLVVAAPALLSHGIVLNTNARDVSELQYKLAEHVNGNPPVLRDLRGMLVAVLDWQDTDIVSDPALLEQLTLSLPEFGITVTPTHAVPNPDGGWQLLIREEPTDTDLDGRSSDDGRGWVASPQTKFERLLRETRVFAGLLSNGISIRLVYAPQDESSGHISFPIANMLTVRDRPILAAFHMLLHVERLFGAPDSRLSALLNTSRRYQAEVSEVLSAQVLGALYELLRGLSNADARTGCTRIADLARTQPDHLYGGLLTTLMRLVFVLYGEDRDLFPSHDVWQQSYSIAGLFERLRDDAARYPDTMDSRYGAWAQLLAVFRIIHGGARHCALELPARRGELFDPDRFPFLEGRDTATDTPRPPHVADGTVWHMLSRLMVLKGERLSYRWLDVEQLGAVYETMMGFTVQLTSGASIAVKPDESGGAATIVNLETLLSLPAAKRGPWLKDNADRKVSPGQDRALRAAATVPALAAALERVQDLDASPAILSSGMPVLQSTASRRKSGSHYTPRSLTKPIVETALRPQFLRLGENPTPEALLALRVLDPAMGSGAFLVETCRQLADALVDAWHRHGTTPRLPPDQDASIYARRLVTQRCLYGVDRNRMAVELARMSLWLSTLARDHEFTFLDHALRWGDSLLGLSLKHIGDLSWTET